MHEVLQRRVLIGTCGFAEAQSRTFRDLDLVEIQQTLYQGVKRRVVLLCSAVLK